MVLILVNKDVFEPTTMICSWFKTAITFAQPNRQVSMPGTFLCVVNKEENKMHKIPALKC